MNDLYEMGLSTVQIRTGICLEKLKLSNKEKAQADKKIQIIYMLDDLVFLSQNESLVLEMSKFNDNLETSFNESLKLAKKSSYLD